MQDQTMSFEEAFAALEEGAEKLRSGRLGLEESIEVYEKCISYHKLCREILDTAKQKIGLYRPQTDTVEELSDEKR